MKKTMTIHKLAALVAMLVGSMTAEAQTAGGPKGATERVAGIRDIRPQPSAARAAERQGVTAVLQYEKIADMPTPRMSHQVLPSGNGFVVVGGRTTGFVPTKTAEPYQDGGWRSLSIAGTHDGAFSVKLADGRYMVGGGFSKQGGVGQTAATDIYDPQAHAFSAGPQLTLARAQAKAIGTGGLVYVSGNWYATDNVMDRYDGSAFQAVGNMDGRSNPYLMADAEGNLLVFSAYNTEGKSFGFRTYDDGSVGLLADKMGVGSEMGDMSGIVMKFDKQQGGTIDAKFYFVGEDGAGEVVGTTSLIQGSDGEFSITVPVRRQPGRRLPIIKLLT